jgi:hypothetical protein
VNVVRERRCFLLSGIPGSDSQSDPSPSELLSPELKLRQTLVNRGFYSRHFGVRVSIFASPFPHFWRLVFWHIGLQILILLSHACLH